MFFGEYKIFESDDTMKNVKSVISDRFQKNHSKMKRSHEENTKFTIEPLGFENRVDEAVMKALLDLSKIPLKLSNQPIILSCRIDDEIFTNIAYWPLTLDIGRRVVAILENYDDTNSVKISYNMLMIALKVDSTQYQRVLLDYFKLTDISLLGQVMCVNNGQPTEECFKKENDTLPEVSIDQLNSHLYIINCYAYT